MAGVAGRSGGRRKGAGRKPGPPRSPPPRRHPGSYLGTGLGKFVPTEQQRTIVQLSKALGLPVEQMVSLIINPHTKLPIAQSLFYEVFQADLERGFPHVAVQAFGALYQNAIKNNNVTAQMYILNRIVKLTEAPASVDVNATITKNGADLDDIGEQLVAAIARLRVDGGGDESGDSEPYRGTTH